MPAVGAFSRDKFWCKSYFKGRLKFQRKEAILSSIIPQPAEKVLLSPILAKCRSDAGATTFGADRGIRVDWISVSDSSFDDHHMGSKHFLRTPSLRTVFLLHNCD